jgi:uncharacterized membrane protein
LHRNSLLFLLSGLFLIILSGTIIFFLIPKFTDQGLSSPVGEGGFNLPADTVKARVLEIVEEGSITLGDHTQEYQVMQVELLEGYYTGERLTVDYGQYQIRPEGLVINPGDQILVTVGQRPDGEVTAYFTDFVRTRPILLLLGTFIFFSILVSGWKGVRSLIGMFFSLSVIIGYIIPEILQGKDPILVSITGAFVLLAVTLYLVYGWTLKTHSAVLGMFVALLITGFLASYFINLTRLTGFGSEESLYLIQMTDVRINLRGLVLGSMIIGALGVLDDLVTTQASAIFELHAADRNQNLTTLYQRGMRIGKDHVAATINTLVLAYAGAAMPMLLLFTLSGQQFGYLVNLEFVTEEIVRTLVGSLGLILAVPITTGLASFIALNQHNFGAIRRFLGPANQGESGHIH